MRQAGLLRTIGFTGVLILCAARSAHANAISYQGGPILTDVTLYYVFWNWDPPLDPIGHSPQPSDCTSTSCDTTRGVPYEATSLTGGSGVPYSAAGLFAPQYIAFANKYQLTWQGTNEAQYYGGLFSAPSNTYWATLNRWYGCNDGACSTSTDIARYNTFANAATSRIWNDNVYTNPAGTAYTRYIKAAESCIKNGCDPNNQWVDGPGCTCGAGDACTCNWAVTNATDEVAAAVNHFQIADQATADRSLIVILYPEELPYAAGCTGGTISGSYCATAPLIGGSTVFGSHNSTTVLAYGSSSNTIHINYAEILYGHPEAISHEVAEALTDPNPGGSWTTGSVNFGELADVCNGLLTPIQIGFTSDAGNRPVVQARYNENLNSGSGGCGFTFDGGGASSAVQDFLIRGGNLYRNGDLLLTANSSTIVGCSTSCTLTGAPAAVAWDNGYYDVYAWLANGDMVRITYSYGYPIRAWDLGAGPASNCTWRADLGLEATSFGADRIDMFAVAHCSEVVLGRRRFVDHLEQLHYDNYAWQNGNNWTAWSSPPSNGFGSGPAVSEYLDANGLGTFNVFVLDKQSPPHLWSFAAKESSSQPLGTEAAIQLGAAWNDLGTLVNEVFTGQPDASPRVEVTTTTPYSTRYCSDVWMRSAGGDLIQATTCDGTNGVSWQAFQVPSYLSGWVDGDPTAVRKGDQSTGVRVALFNLDTWVDDYYEYWPQNNQPYSKSA